MLLGRGNGCRSEACPAHAFLKTWLLAGLVLADDQSDLQKLAEDNPRRLPCLRHQTDYPNARFPVPGAGFLGDPPPDREYRGSGVLRLIDVPLTDGQFDALVSFTFNLGTGALQPSTLRRMVNREEHAQVPWEFMRWVWAGGRKLRGLILRRSEKSGDMKRRP